MSVTFNLLITYVSEYHKMSEYQKYRGILKIKKS